jgi:hypothetical protein
VVRPDLLTKGSILPETDGLENNRALRTFGLGPLAPRCYRRPAAKDSPLIRYATLMDDDGNVITRNGADERDKVIFTNTSKEYAPWLHINKCLSFDPFNDTTTSICLLFSCSRLSWLSPIDRCRSSKQPFTMSMKTGLMLISAV